jgi:FKBP-type peptidyl-prolyl cis-trans isomerase
MPFFGGVVKAGKSLKADIPGGAILQMSSAALGPGTRKGRTTLLVKTAVNDVKLALCTLTCGEADHFELSHCFSDFDGPVVFTATGPAEIHVTGYRHDTEEGESSLAELEDYAIEQSQQQDDEDEEEEEDDQPKVQVMNGPGIMVDAPKKRKTEQVVLLPNNKKARLKERIMGNGLRTQDTVIGKGKQPKLGSAVKLLYVGTLENGHQFDATKKRSKPFMFRYGSCFCFIDIFSRGLADLCSCVRSSLRYWRGGQGNGSGYCRDEGWRQADHHHPTGTWLRKEGCWWYSEELDADLRRRAPPCVELSNNRVGLAGAQAAPTAGTVQK